MAWLSAEQNGAARPGCSPRMQACPKRDAAYPQGTVPGRAWVENSVPQVPPRAAPSVLPGVLAEPITGNTAPAPAAPAPYVMPSFEAMDTNRDGVISRAEFQNATAGMVYAAPRGTVRSVSPLPTPLPTPGPLITYGQVHPRAVSPDTSRSPIGRRLVASPTAVQVPVQTIAQVPAAQPLTVPSIQIVPPSEASQPSHLSEDLLKRIDGVVSEMERELSDDLAACVKSPLVDLKDGQKVEVSGNDDDDEADNDSTIDWIDKQIRSIESRREACESRQAHLTDLRRLVSDRGRRPLLRDDGLLSGDEETARASPARRLSILEGEHEELKKQVETERVELVKVRANLEMECERRLQEARALAESVQESRQRALAAEEAANQQSKDASNRLQLLQERLRETEATLERERQQFRLLQEAQAAAGADLRQLEENSRTVLADNQTLQQRVREMELERSVFLEVQAKSEEERKALVARIRQAEEDKGREIESALHSHREQWREAASRETQQLRASLTATHSKNLKTAEKQGEVRVSEAQAAVLKELEEWKDRCSRLQADKEAEENSRVEMQRLHAQVTEDATKLRDDQEKLKASLASEVRAKEQFQRQHEAVVQDMDKLKSDQAELSKDQEAEKRARLLAEQKHAASLQDMERMRSDQERLQADKIAEQAARQKVEQEHQAVLQDMERVRADHQRVTREKEDEARLRQEAERKHAEVQRDLNKVKDDQRRLQSDKEAEERAKLEVQRLHQAVLDEKNSLHGNHTHLQELLSAEKKAKDEMQRRHTMVENDKQKMLRDQAELQEAKAREEKLKMEAERQHQKLIQDMEKLRQDQAQLNADKEDEKKAKEEAERKHASVLRDMQQLQVDRDKLQADQVAEKRAREEAERKHAEVLQDRDKIAADMRQLQSDKDSEQRAKQEIERKHDAAMKQMELVNADQTKLKMDKDSEVQTRLDMEAKHQAVLRDLEQLRAEKDQIATEHNSLKMEHQRLEAERNRLHASHAEASRGHEEAIGRLRTAHETELKQTKDQSQQHKQEWEGRHQSLLQELEGLRAELRRAQQEKEDERRAKERAQADRQSASRQSEALQVQVQSIQSRRNSDLSSLEDVQSRVRSLQSENEMLTGDVNTLKKLKQEKEEAEKDLREAFNIQRTELKTIQRQLEDREQQVKEFEEWRKNLEDKYSGLLSQLSAEKKEGEDLRRELREAQATGEQLQRNAQEALDRLLLLQQENEDLKESLESKTRGESEALKRRMTMPRMSLWAVPPVLAIEEEADLLPHSKDEFIAQVRDAHKGVDSLMQSAAEVHIRTISAQVDGAAAAESKGTGIRRGLADYEKQYEIQSERRSELNNLEARLHDLRALKEEVALQHHLPEVERNQVTEYLERDMKRCEEEIEIMRPSSALSSLPDELIQVLMHMVDEGLPPEFEHGFSPMHWSAQRGRRDLIEFIRQQVDGGHELLNSRDAQGRIPLFFAERSGKVGLAYHLRRIGGSADLLVRSSEKRPDTEGLAPAYKKVLDQIEQRGWQSMKWKDDFTMLHWAASHGKKDLCLYLLSQQANPMDKDNKGRTAAAVAAEANHFEVVAAIQDKVTMPRKSVSHLIFSTPTE